MKRHRGASPLGGSSTGIAQPSQIGSWRLQTHPTTAVIAKAIWQTLSIAKTRTAVPNLLGVWSVTLGAVAPKTTPIPTRDIILEREPARPRAEVAMFIRAFNGDTAVVVSSLGDFTEGASYGD
jgi:hypothetical protein